MVDAAPGFIAHAMDAVLLVALLVAALLVYWRSIEHFTDEQGEFDFQTDFKLKTEGGCPKTAPPPCTTTACCAAKDLACHPDPNCAVACTDKNPPKCGQVLRQRQRQRTSPEACNRMLHSDCKDDACCAQQVCHNQRDCTGVCDADNPADCWQVYDPKPQRLGKSVPNPPPREPVGDFRDDDAEFDDKAATTVTSDRIFAPFLETWATHPLDRVPTKNFVLAFLLSKGGQLAWNGTDALSSQKALADSIRKRGGRVILSFGGASGTELANDVSSVDELANKYAQAAKEYQCTWLDFDIEGAAVEYRDVNTRRNKALAKVQKMMPDVYVSYTLAVMPTGMLDSAVTLLKDAKAQGVRVGCVNLMTMDYGDSFGGDMGGYAISAAKSARDQLVKLGMSSTKVGITPMIGKNDNGPRPFDLSNAKAVVDFAKATPWVGLVSYWSLGRDNGKKSTLNASSMITQTDYAFAQIFAGYK